MRKLLLAGVLACATGCTDTSGPSENIDWVVRKITVDERERAYALKFPADTTTPRPLLLLFHGAGGNPLDMFLGTRFGTLGPEEGFVIATLEAVWDVGARWATHPSDLQFIDDVAFVRKAVDSIVKEVKIDQTRIFAVGFSRGGDFVYQLGCRAPELVRGVASLASTMLDDISDWCSTTAGAPAHPALYMVLGSDDALVPWEGGAEGRRAAIATAEFWATRYGCSTTPTEQSSTAAGVTLTQFVYGQCTHELVDLTRVEQLGHAWPGAVYNVEAELLAKFLSLPAR